MANSSPNWEYLDLGILAAAGIVVPALVPDSKIAAEILGLGAPAFVALRRLAIRNLSPHLSAGVGRLLRRKMDRDFDESFIRVGMSEILGDSQIQLKNAGLLDPVDPVDGRRLLSDEPRVPPRLTREERLRTAQLLGNRPIRVNCSILSPAAVAVLLSMKASLKGSIEVDYSDVNGHNQFLRVASDEPFDFLIAAEAPYFIITNKQATEEQRLINPEKLLDYTRLFPCNIEWEHVFIRKGKYNPRTKPNAHVFAASSADLHYMLGLGFPSHRKTIKHGEAIPHLVETLNAGEYILVWEPLATVFETHSDYERVKIPAYRVCISIFCNKEWMTESRQKEREAFQSLFVDEWRRCDEDRNGSFQLLLSREILTHDVFDRFAISAGVRKLKQYARDT